MTYYAPQASANSAIFNLRQRIADAFAGLQKGCAAQREFERLNMMSDAQLAKRGLTRPELPSHIVNTVLR